MPTPPTQHHLEMARHADQNCSARPVPYAADEYEKAFNYASKTEIPAIHSHQGIACRVFMNCTYSSNGHQTSTDSPGKNQHSDPLVLSRRLGQGCTYVLLLKLALEYFGPGKDHVCQTLSCSLTFKPSGPVQPCRDHVIAGPINDNHNAGRRADKQRSLCRRCMTHCSSI